VGVVVGVDLNCTIAGSICIACADLRVVVGVRTLALTHVSGLGPHFGADLRVVVGVRTLALTCVSFIGSVMFYLGRAVNGL
jgi:hypothetical protein